MFRKDVIITYLSFILLLLSLIFTCFIYVGFWDDLSLYSNFHFYIYCFLAFSSFVKERHFSLFQVWIGAFVFIILSEMIIISYENHDAFYYKSAFLFLIAANDAVLLGYLFCRPSVRLHYYYVINRQKQFFYFILLIYVVFLISNFYLIAQAVSSGMRNLGDADSVGNFNFMSTLVGGFGLILPALLAFYYRYCKYSLYKGVIFVLPVILLTMLGGTRFVLLFSFLPFLIISGWISFSKASFREIIRMLMVIVLFGSLSLILVDIRTKAINDLVLGGNQVAEIDDRPFLVRMSSKMSPEGVAYMTKLSDDYFKTHNLHYGKEVGFILYFWIPRSLWPDKPTQLDHWLIREYEDVSDAHSSASGFAGELKADFGWFSLIPLFLLGCYLKKADKYVERVFFLDNNNFSKTIAASVVPYVFFLVRSPLASSFSFILELILLFVIRSKLCVKQRFEGFR